MLSRINTGTTMTDSHPFGPISWLKKKSSAWSLRPQTHFASVSTASLPISLSASESSTTSSSSSSSLSSCTSILSIPEQHTLSPPPPCYDDPSHPWTFKMPDSFSQRVIIPREEEGRETLPPYECSIDKVNYFRVKCEYTKPDLKSKSRSWKEYYVHIYGTKISAYTHNPNRKKSKPMTPVWSYSMQGADISLATDYRKHQNALRLKIVDGPQFLLTTFTAKEKFDCLDVMESSIAVSADLDVRAMLQVPNHQRRRRRNDRR